MKNSKFVRILVIILWVLLGVGIFLNPYTDIRYLELNPGIILNINNFFVNLKLSYKFSSGDLLWCMRFTEYLIFGIITALIVKFYSKNIFKNICTPLFLGLGLSVGEIYFKSICDLGIGLYEVVLSFSYFFAGLVLYMIFSGVKFSGKKNFRYKFSKYGRRR